MTWLSRQPRLTQCFVHTLAQLNYLGIRVNGSEVKPWLSEEADKLPKRPSRDEIATVIAGLLAEGVRFEGPPDSADKFAAHPDFAGLSLRRKT